MARGEIEALDCVHGTEDLLERSAVGAELECEVLAHAEQSMGAAGEAVPIDLIAVPQAWLQDALAPSDFGDEPAQVGQRVGVDRLNVRGDDRAQEKPAETGWRVDRQHEVAEGDAPRRRVRARVPDLELGQQHA
jgi:hypothetical protein